jgi:hypothetical protein
MEFMNVHNTSFHIARIYRRDKLIAEARNRIGSRSRGSGYSNSTLHAEKAVIKMVGNNLKGCTLEVIRLNKHNELLNSKPCPDCAKFLDKCFSKYGLLSVRYSLSALATL